METALVPLGESFAVARPAEEVLAEATRAAKSLKEVLAQKEHKVVMNGQQYLEFEDWQTLGRFYGVTAAEEGDATYVEMGSVKGFRATAVALDRDGRIVSRATAFCLDDEEKWGSRPKYAWGYVCTDGSWQEDDPGPGGITWIDNPRKPGGRMPLKERRLVGEEMVPLYQLSSMAQTRANAKALRNVLSWVAVLGGYRPTPAEELDERAQRQPQGDAVEGEYREVPATPPAGARGPRSAAPPTAPPRPAPPKKGDEPGKALDPMIQSRDAEVWRRYVNVRDEARTVLPDQLLPSLPLDLEPPVLQSVLLAAGLNIREALDAARSVGVSKTAGAEGPPEQPPLVEGAA